MSETSLVEIGLAILGALVMVIGYLLQQKDVAQGKSIELLFDKHDTDVQALQELRERIAGRHYERGELDAKFEKLEAAFKEGFDQLGKKFDHLSDVLINQIRSK